MCGVKTRGKQIVQMKRLWKVKPSPDTGARDESGKELLETRYIDARSEDAAELTSTLLTVRSQLISRRCICLTGGKLERRKVNNVEILCLECFCLS